MHDHHLFFLHLMKTGGTSLYRFLENNYAVGEYIADDKIIPARSAEFYFANFSCEARRRHSERIRMCAELAQYKLIAKFHFSHLVIDDFRQLYPFLKVISVFRDPVERVFSQIEHWRRIPDVHMKTVAPELVSMINDVKRGDLDAVLHGERDSHHASFMENYQAKRLAGYVSSVPADDILLETALKNLENIDLVGVTDRLDMFAEIISFNLGFYNTYSDEKLNVTPQSARLDPVERERLKDILSEKNRIDAIVFEEAKKRFDRHVQDYHDALFQLRGGQKLRTLVPGEEATFGMESALVGEGWLEREAGLGGGCARWGGPGPSSVLYPAIALQGEICLDFNIVSVIDDEIYASMQIFINGSYAPHQNSIRDGFLVASVKMRSAEQGFSGARVEFRFAGVKSAFEVQGVADHRRKTIALQNVQMRRVS
ncbi:hypothetical protein [Pseudomonas kuykendallii]|uniref:Sulfotransferase family protein n=1 Tax=Pseudomonas kuykendallii TaxID=1007099 RepID=A0A2W5D436_9PSED|nr:hypothetical protein [Pseudomonas kuykendallii]PZP25013.1 MAG: hypothetical protein DI599_07305 [Pseudomonas kuykendallii]